MSVEDDTEVKRERLVPALTARRRLLVLLTDISDLLSSASSVVEALRVRVRVVTGSSSVSSALSVMRRAATL